MSGHTFETLDCPNCKNTIETYEDWIPIPYYKHFCYHCGWITYNADMYLDLETLNKERENYGLDPLEKLPPQTEEVFVQWWQGNRRG